MGSTGPSLARGARRRPGAGRRGGAWFRGVAGVAAALVVWREAGVPTGLRIVSLGLLLYTFAIQTLEYQVIGLLVLLLLLAVREERKRGLLAFGSAGFLAGFGMLIKFSLGFGALVLILDTDFDGCMRVLNEVVRRMPIYLLNSVNPYRIEGQKTAAIELLEQFDWRVPDHVIVPGGNLGNSSALGKAFLEMKQLGLISSLPRVSIIQAEGANPLVRSIRESGGKKLVPVQAETMATAIRIGNPASWEKAVHILEATGGTVEQVSEVEIALAKAEIGADGIGCEPASAVTLAGLKKLVKQGFIRAEETVVLILTGHLLKDPEFTLKFHRGDLFTGTAHQKEAGILTVQQRAPIALDASVDAVLRILQKAERPSGV